MSPRTGTRSPKPTVQTPGQLDLFGDPVTTPEDAPATSAAAPSTSTTNDMDLITTIAANAALGIYVLAGASERVYVRVDGPNCPDIQRVPRYEEAAVQQLLTAGLLTIGGRTKDLSCGAVTLTGTTVSCPKPTRARVQRWAALQRPTSWGASSAPTLRVVKGGQS